MWLLKVLICMCVFNVTDGLLQHRNLRSSTRGLPRYMTMKLESITVEPISTISGEVTLPGSKSLSNRVLLLAAVSEGTTVVDNLLDSDDIRYMVGALNR